MAVKTEALVVVYGGRERGPQAVVVVNQIFCLRGD